MVEVLFRRHTHNPDGSFRLPLGGEEPKVIGLGVHALDSDEFHSFSMFVGEHIRYAEQFPDSPCPEVVDLLLDLAELVNSDLVEVKVKK